MSERPRVVVVTGGGAGIGAAIAEELGRQGAFVVTMDPLVSLDGSEQLPSPEETTAGRIVAAGGSARATSVSVTDAAGVRELFASLAEEFGRLDAVINVAGISRPTNFADGTEADWRAVLEVHLDGYRNVLAAALPLMVAAGYGRILGVTSGSGWRGTVDAGAYGCAKRAVASLTWQLGRAAPPGVVVNAVSPIAVTRMVTAALERAGAAAGNKAAGPLFGSMPEPEALGPIAAHLVGDDFSWCSGEVIFAAGSEVARVEPPGLLEVVRTDDAVSIAHALEAVSAKTWVPAEASQLSGGGSNPRLGSIYEPPTDDLPPAAVSTCAVVADSAEVGAAITAALEARGVKCMTAASLDGLEVDGVVVALAGGAASAASGWEAILAEHAGIVDGIHADAMWARAVADYAAANDRPVRLVTVTDAVTAGGRSRAQAAAQLARTARKTTKDRVAAFSISVEAADTAAAELAAHLVCSPDAVALSGAELVAGDGWFGLRSHPRPTASVSFAGPAIPGWFDDTLRSIIG
jgi:NAD(P)-dependent dehydrogenase (short-subunit alcohol dehydrogenase family)